MKVGAFQNAMRLQAQRAVAEMITSRIGTVKSYDPNEYIAKVQLQPDSLITGWLPVASSWMGNGWGMFCPPSPGDMVSVVFINGDLNAGYVESRFWNDEDRPVAVDSGECWLLHKSGAYFKLTNDGKASFSDGQGATVTLNGDGTITSQASNWSHTGPMSIDGNVSITGNETVSGNVNCSGTVTGTTDVVGGGKSLKTHVHGGVQSGGSDTSPPV